MEGHTPGPGRALLSTALPLSQQDRPGSTRFPLDTPHCPRARSTLLVLTGPDPGSARPGTAGTGSGPGRALGGSLEWNHMPSGNKTHCWRSVEFQKTLEVFHLLLQTRPVELSSAVS